MFYPDSFVLVCQPFAGVGVQTRHPPQKKKDRKRSSQSDCKQACAAKAIPQSTMPLSSQVSLCRIKFSKYFASLVESVWAWSELKIEHTLNFSPTKAKEKQTENTRGGGGSGEVRRGGVGRGG